MPLEDMTIRPGYEQRAGAERDPRLDWWRQAKFGLFIHWGLYAMPHERWSDWPITVSHHYTGEWVQHVRRIPGDVYQRCAAEFNPVDFDADAWVALARRAGMRYMVITAKHHDGFCLFRSKVTGFNLADATPFGRDVIAELAEACRRQDFPFGVYYSQTQDWSRPGGAGNRWDAQPPGASFEGYLEETVKPHLHELLTGYGPIAIVWFDTPGAMTPDQSRDLIDTVHALQPNCLVSGRIGNGLGDYASFRDNRFPGSQQAMDWESPATMNRTWGYVADDHGWKTTPELLRTLLDCASKGGNFLLNVGPDGRGRIPQASVERLEAMGRWLADRGEGVYGTTAGPIQDRYDLCTTRAGNRVFVHVLTWPLGDLLELPWTDAPPAAARELATGQNLPITTGPGTLQIRLPHALLAGLPVSIALDR